MKSIQIIFWVLAAGLFWLTGSLQASDANLSRSIDGVDIYMGITHANKQAQADEMKKSGLIQAIRSKKHHITVALFDSKTGQRITDARVVAGIGEMGLSSNRKKLRQEKFGEAVSYGRDFYLSQEGPYWIDLKIKRNGDTQSTMTRFEWKHY